MTDEELREKIKAAQTEIDNISYELSNLIKQKDSGAISEEQFKEAEKELQGLLSKHSKELTEYKIELDKKSIKLEDTKVELPEEVLKAQEENNLKIEEAKKELEVARRQFEHYTKVMQEVYSYSNNKLQKGPLSNNEIHEVYDDYYAAMYGNEAVWKEYRSEMTRLRRKIQRLERKNKILEEHYVEATNLELGYSEYLEIIKTLESRKRLTTILEQKGLGDIIHKRGGRSNKERELLQEAKNQIVNEILNLQKKDKKITILDAINILYMSDNKVSIKEAARTLKIPPKTYDKIQARIDAQPRALPKKDEPKKEVTKDTPKAPEDMVRTKVLVDHEYEPDRIMYESRGMTEEEYIISEFERTSGIKFDPEIHEIVYNHDASGIVSDDDVYSTYSIIEKPKPIVPDEPEYDLVTIHTDYEPDRIMYEARGMTEEEYIISEFEKASGKKFDPEIHEIVYNHDASGVVSDDDVYSTYSIIEKVPKEAKKEAEKEEVKEKVKELPPSTSNTMALPGESIDGKRVGFGKEDVPRLPEHTEETKVTPKEVAETVAEEMQNVEIEERNLDEEARERISDVLDIKIDEVPQEAIDAVVESVDSKPTSFDVLTDEDVAEIARELVVQEEKADEKVTNEDVREAIASEMDGIELEEPEKSEEVVTPPPVVEVGVEEEEQATAEDVRDAIASEMDGIELEEPQAEEEAKEEEQATAEDVRNAIASELDSVDLGEPEETKDGEDKELYTGYVPEKELYESRGMTEDEYMIEEFERETGTKFDPDIHEIRRNHDASGIVSDDNVHSTFTIVEKAKKIDPTPTITPTPTKPTPTKPTPTKPMPTKPTPTKPTPTKPTPTKPTPTKPTPTKPTPTKPTPTDPTPTKPTPTVEPTHTEDRRPLGLREIINGKICKGLEITKKDADKYRWSNARIWKSFVDELHSGNVVYNILHVVPGLVKLAGSAFMKLTKGVFGTKRANDLVKEMKSRIDNLSEEELETLFNGYRSGYIIQEGYPQVINMIIEEKMNEYIMGKVTAINNELVAAYKIVVTNYKLIAGIDAKLREKGLTKKTRDKLKAERKKLLEDAAANCIDIKVMQEEARNLLSGGLHGMSEDMKASLTKMNLDGMRFAKTYDYDNDLEDKLEAAEKQFLDGVSKGDAQAVLSGFLKEERLLAANTRTDDTIIGKISKGKKHYSPLVERLDYNPDPLVKDLFTMIAVTSAAISAVNAVRVNIEQQRILEAHQQEIANVNNANNQTMTQVNQTGAEIAGKRDVFASGMRAQTEQNVLSRTNVHERASLDQTGWSIGTDQYHVLDHARHEAAQQFYTDTYMQMQDVSVRYAQGIITQDQALQELADIATQSHKTFTDTVSDVLRDTEAYAASHPQHDLTAVLGTMRYFANNTEAISQMNQGMVDVTNLGESLIGLTAEQATAIQSLPSDLATTLVAAASATALAYNVARDFNKKVQRSKSQHNEVTEMVNELNSSDENEVSRKK